MVSRDDRNGEDKTSVDLGLDLLESPTLTGSHAAIPAASEHAFDPSNVGANIEDEVKSAEILAGEGLIDEAKRKLRAILRVDPGSVQARRALDLLLNQELERILSDLKSATPVSQTYVTKAPTSAAMLEPHDGESPSDVLEALEGEFNLSEHTDELSMLGEHNGLEAFLAGLDRDTAGTSDRDRIDLGIGFLEMGMPRVALHLFEKAKSEREMGLGLRAQALVRAGRPLDAVVILEEGLHDAEILEDQKLEYLYWMGRAQERLKLSSPAQASYGRLLAAAPQYRDTRDRLRRLEGGQR